MSYLKGLMLQGVRSFGPEETDKQKIVFFTPLTLILGPNGTGKTTIIESLRFITTGDQPPQSKGGFFHDPKLVATSEVKAQVKLAFYDVEQNVTVATRSVLAQNRKSKASVKSLDSVIEKTLPNGEKTSITQKCAQIEKEMINCLGVSKAVLTDVIFCHQEESNWPLGEGKTVKERFDAIFAATRYIKALNEITNIRKIKDGEVKEYRAEIKHLRANKDKSFQFATDLREKEAQYSACQEQIKDIDAELKPLRDKLIKCGEIEKELNEWKSKEAREDTLLQQAISKEMDLLKSIKDRFTGSDAELAAEINNFQIQFQHKKEQYNEEKGRSKRIEGECHILRNKKSSVMMDLGKLETIQQQHEGRVSLRNTKVNQVSSVLKMTEFSGKKDGYTEDEIAQFTSKLMKKITSLQDEHDIIKSEYEIEENSMQKEMETHHDQKMKLEQTIHLNKNRLKKNKDEIEVILRTLRKVDASVEQKKQLETTIAKLELKKVDLEGTLDVKVIRGEIEALSKNRNELEKKLNDLNQEITRLHTEGKKRTELDFIVQTKNAKDEESRKLSSRHEDMIKHLLGGQVPNQNIIRDLDAANNKLNREIKADTKVLNDMKSKLSSLETSRSFEMEQLRKKEETLRKYEDKIFDVAGSSNFAETLNVTQANLQTYQDAKGALCGSQVVLATYIDKLMKPKPCCPLCMRGFEDESQEQELVSHLQRKLAVIPEQMEEKEEQIAQLTKKQTDLLELRPIQEEAKKLNDKEMPEIRKRVQDLNRSIAEIKQQISDSEENLDMKQVDHKSYLSIQPDMLTVNSLQAEVLKLNKQITVLKGRLGVSNEQSRSMEEVNDEREENQLKLKSVNSSLESLQKKLNDHTDVLQNLNSQINRQNADLLKIIGEQQKRQSLEEQKTKLTTENEELTTSIQQSQQEADTQRSKLADVKSKKAEITSCKENKLHDFQAELDKLQNYNKDISAYTKEVKNYVESGQDNKIQDCRRRIDQLTTQVKTHEDDYEKSISNAEKLQTELSNQENKYRDLEDNKKLKECKKDIAKLEAQCAATKAKIGGFGKENLFQEKDKLLSRYNKLQTEKTQKEGSQKEKEISIKALKRELEDDQFKDADKKYKGKLIQLRTNELCSEDLAKYARALDKAVMEYHKIKMTEVNKIIKQLWKKTYRGNDINFIEIITDETEHKAGRNAYNYRVVMYTHGRDKTSIDMRGRCSAGQKVLASLIIRLALAETFCLNCGVLALDEPTTNLDRDNIESLAHALVQIVQSRSQQKNFQLVVITHDEDFIQLLSRSNIVDYFYKVSKDPRGCSRLTKCLISDI